MKPENRQKVLMIVAAAAVALMASDYLVLSPLQAAWKKRSERIVELERRIDNGRSLISREDRLRDRWSMMRANTLPTQFSAAEQKMLGAFDAWAGESRITVSSLSPQWRSELDDRASLQCRVEAVGDLSTITRFLYSIERDPMAIRIDSMELTSRDATGSQLALTLQANGLVLLPKESSGINNQGSQRADANLSKR